MGFSRDAHTSHDPKHSISSVQAVASPIPMSVPAAELNAVEGMHMTGLSHTPVGAEVFH